MRILMTGEAGFTGSELVRATPRDELPGFADTNVTLLDKLTYSGNPDNLAPIADPPRYRFGCGRDDWLEVIDFGSTGAESAERVVSDQGTAAVVLGRSRGRTGSSSCRSPSRGSSGPPRCGTPRRAWNPRTTYDS